MKRQFGGCDTRECQVSREALAPGLSRAIRQVRGLTSKGTRFVSGKALAAGNSPENIDPESPVASAKPLKVSAIRLTPPGSPKLAARAGVTLIQTLVVIALTGVITTAAITTIITMLRLQGHTTQVWMSQQSLLRLSDEFRSDAHAAKVADITTQNDASAVIFQSSTEAMRSVTYLVAKHQVTRRETDGDKLLRTEVYRLPDSEVTFGSTTSKNDPPRLVTGETVRLTCRRPNAPTINQRTPPPLHDEHVVAVIGRDHRFEKP